MLPTGLIGGVEKREIRIAEYDADWPRQFAVHARAIADALGPVALQVEHVGSTSAPGLGAKPIIDMLLVVADAADEALYLPAMEAAGYVLRAREPDWYEHRMFRTPAKDVHIHVFPAGCCEVERMLTFRDRLRANAEDRQRYEAVKRELAAREWPDMNAYADAKSGVIESILAAAKEPG